MVGLSTRQFALQSGIALQVLQVARYYLVAKTDFPFLVTFIDAENTKILAVMRLPRLWAALPDN